MRFLLQTLTLLLLGFTACTPAKMLPRQTDFKVGESTIYRNTKITETKVTDPDSGEEQTTLANEITDISYTVMERYPDGSVKIKMQNTRIQKSSTDPKGGPDKVFDSNNPPADDDDLEAKITHRIKDHAFFFKLSPEGKITDFEGVESFWDKIKDEMPDQKTADMVIGPMKAQFNSETLAQSAEELWGFYPSKPIRVGKTWERKTVFGGFNLLKETTYTLKEQNESESLVTTLSKVGSEPGKPSEMDMGVIKIEFDLSGDSKASIRIDNKGKGILLMEENLNMDGYMKPKVSFMEIPKMPISMTIKSKLERIQ
ncbi:MAG: DUF6263 family protein [Saprospiraceae bacterium]